MAVPDLTTRTVAPIQIETALGMPVAIVVDVSVNYEMAGKVAVLRLHDPVPLDPTVPAWQIDSVANIGDVLIMGQQIQVHVASDVDGGGGVLYGSLALARYNYALEIGPPGLEAGAVDADWRINGTWELDPAQGMVGPQPVGAITISFKNHTAIFQLVTPVYFNSYIDAVLALEPVGYWPLADRSGSVARAAVDSPAQDGVYSGVTIADILGPDGLNPAPSFDGVNDFADIYSTALEAVMPRDAGSLMLWLRVRNSATWPEASYMDAYYFRWDANNYLRFSKVGLAAFPYLSTTVRASGATFFRDVTTEPIGWFHVIMTWDHTAPEASDNLVLYLNGVFFDQRSLTQDNVGTALDPSSVIIGAENNFSASRPWDGWLAHGAVFDRVLTPAEVASLYVVPPAPATYIETVLSLGPIAYWPLNDQAGSTAVCVVNSAQSGSYGSGVVLDSIIGPDGANGAPLFDGTVTGVNIYSAAFAGVFNGDEGSLSVWFQVQNAGVWSDGVRGTVIGLGADTSNEYDVEKGLTANQLITRRRAGGSVASRNWEPGPSVNWIHVAITWSLLTDELFWYLDNVRVAGGGGLTSFVGSLNSNRCALASYLGTGDRNFKGYVAHAAVFDYPLTSDEVNLLYIAQ